MKRKSAFERLTGLASQIDALNKKADTLAKKLLGARTAREQAAISRSGEATERRLRELEREYRGAERSLLRPSRPELRRRREKDIEEQSILEQLRPGQRFMLQAVYRRKNHNLFADIIVTFIGLPLDERADRDRIIDAVRELADNKKPRGFSVERVAYDGRKGATRRTARNKSELDKVGAALHSNKTHWTVGEL